MWIRWQETLPPGIREHPKLRGVTKEPQRRLVTRDAQCGISCSEERMRIKHFRGQSQCRRMSPNRALPPRREKMEVHHEPAVHAQRWFTPAHTCSRTPRLRAPNTMRWIGPGGRVWSAGSALSVSWGLRRGSCRMTCGSGLSRFYRSGRDGSGIRVASRSRTGRCCAGSCSYCIPAFSGSTCPRSLASGPA